MTKSATPEPSAASVSKGSGFAARDMPAGDNPYVLSAAAHGALTSEPATTLALEGTYPLSHAEFAGNVSVMPGTMRGSNRVGVYLRRQGERDGGVRLFANVRTSWLHSVCREAASDGERAVLLAAALCELAALPGQRTVTVMTDHKHPGEALQRFARLLREAAAPEEPAA